MTDLSPIGWAIQPLKRYADFRGRSSRAEFWWFMLAIVIVYLGFWFVMIGAIGGMAATGGEPSLGMFGALGFGFLAMMFVALALLIPTIAVQVRRLHDIGRSGWWLAGYYLLYAVYIVALMSTAFSAAAAGDPESASALFAGIGLLGLLMFVYFVVLLVFYCLPGTRGANRYGADPYARDVADVFA